MSNAISSNSIWDKTMNMKSDYAYTEGNAFEKHAQENTAKMLEISRLNADGTAKPGACTKCGHIGHLPFQCRNNFKLKNSKQESLQVSSYFIYLFY